MDKGTTQDICLAGRYGAFSVSSSNMARVIKYIDNQEAHRRKVSFEDEFISLLKKHKISFDPKYVFG
jgi:putative transposase